MNQIKYVCVCAYKYFINICKVLKSGVDILILYLVTYFA